MSERIRWDDSRNGPGHPAFAGNVGDLYSLFKIWSPEDPGDEWLLTAALPGKEGERLYGFPIDLKLEAERWLEELVSSLGAVFPETSDAIVRWRDVRAGDLVLLDDELTPVESANVLQKPWGDETTFTAVDVGYRLDNGVFVTSERHGDRYTAVRKRSPDPEPAPEAAGTETTTDA